MGTLQPLAVGDLGGHFAGLNIKPDAISIQKLNDDDSHTAFVTKNEG